MPLFDHKLSSIKVKEKKGEIETYEANMKIFIKKIKIKNKFDFDRYKNHLSNIEGIFNIIKDNSFIYIYYDLDKDIDELLLNEIKEGIQEGFCEPIKKTEIEELLLKEKSMCKINFKKIQNDKLENGIGTGFFLEFNYKDIPFTKCLITNNHILNGINSEDEVTIQYLNQTKVIELTKKGKKRKIFTNNILDYSLIELFDDDEFKEYFRVDSLIIKNAPNIFNQQDIFILQYPNGNELSFSIGKVLDINDKKILHNCSTNKGSSGSPIISRFSGSRIIGLHFAAETNTKNNLARPILSILDDINEKIKGKIDNNNNNNINNYIIAKIEIKNEHINRDIRIIDSFEQIDKEGKHFKYKSIYPKFENEKEIKENIEITIEEQVIQFDYFHKFEKPGKYEIRYSFKKPLKKTNHLFSQCDLFTDINLYNFDTSNVTNMESMFWGCKSLKDINLSALNTENVENFSFMFYGCESLTNLDLSSFNTQKALEMKSMFSSCSTLKSLNLKNFNCQKDVRLDLIFKDCKELKKQNLKCNDSKIKNELLNK